MGLHLIGEAFSLESAATASENTCVSYGLNSLKGYIGDSIGL